MVVDGIKSKERVVEFGEVLTPENIVNDMLDLVKDESYSLVDTFLEPACGNGNFLVKILERKLDTVAKLVICDYDRNLFVAFSSIYGIDIQNDNIEEAKRRMVKIVKKKYKEDTDKEMSEEIMKVVKFVLDTNIIIGDALTGIRNDGKEIIISEWITEGELVKRKDYNFIYLTSDLLCDSDVVEYKETHFKNIHKNTAEHKKDKESLFDEL